MKRKNQSIAIALLFVLIIAIIPAETFHHHQEKSVICIEKAIHFEVKHFECKLWNFVMPTILQEAEEKEIYISSSQFFYSFEKTPSGVSSFFDVPKYRGPPEIA